jgi:uncharacterized protein YndB with AHSA1/START domain
MNNSITVTVVVRVEPEAAFLMFTGEIDAWWKQGPQYRSGNGGMRFDADRLLEGDVELGRVLAWEPGRRLLIEFRNWRLSQGEPSEVEVRFEPDGDGTRVTVTHSGWETRPTGAAEFRTVVGLWWGTLLAALQGHRRGQDA